MQYLLAGALLALVWFSPEAVDAAVMGVVPETGGAAAVPVYIARPAGNGPFPAVLFLHGCDGFGGFMTVAADRLAAHGFIAVALDSFGLHGPANACSGATGSSHEADDARVVLTWLRTQPDVNPARLGLVGFSMGGNAALELVDPPDSTSVVPAGVRAAVAYYPWCADRGSAVRVPTAIFDGDADRVTPSAACVALGRSAPGVVDVTVYPGATHAFNTPGPDRRFDGEPIHYDPTTALDAAQKTLLFLTAHLH